MNKTFIFIWKIRLFATFQMCTHTRAKTNFLSRNYQEFDVWKMWILWKMRFWKCEFCEKWDFENVNFVKNVLLKLWILWKMWFSECEFCKNWDFQNVNFWINWGFLPQYDLHIYIYFFVQMKSREKCVLTDPDSPSICLLPAIRFLNSLSTEDSLSCSK